MSGGHTSKQVARAARGRKRKIKPMQNIDPKNKRAITMVTPFRAGKELHQHCLISAVDDNMKIRKPAYTREYIEAGMPENDNRNFFDGGAKASDLSS